MGSFRFFKKIAEQVELEFFLLEWTMISNNIPHYVPMCVVQDGQKCEQNLLLWNHFAIQPNLCIWVKVFNTTFNNISVINLYHGCQFNWWRKPEYL